MDKLVVFSNTVWNSSSLLLNRQITVLSADDGQLWWSHRSLPVTTANQMFTCEAWSTLTPVPIHLVHACAVVLTGSGSTLVDVQVTVITLKSRHTEALVAINSISTDGSVLTRLRLAFIYVHIAVCPLVPISTLTLGPNIRNVCTSAAILTGLLWTHGHVLLAGLSSWPKGAVTGVSIDSVDAQWAGACTGVTLTFIYILAAVEACETIRAVAGELSGAERAGAVGACCCDTGVIQLSTVYAHIPHWSLRADAHIVTQVVKTRGSILAWKWQTLVCCRCAQKTWNKKQNYSFL